MITPTFDSALEQVKELVDDFSTNEPRYKSPEYQEAEVRKDFLDKFFITLGWDVNHDHQKNPYEQEVKVERKPDKKNQRRADYAFYISPNYRDARFFVEAKKPSITLHNAQDYFQAIRYGWGATTPIVVLTDFEEFHILDCRYKPDISTVLTRKIKEFRYHDYINPDTFAEIFYLFSREAVSTNSLEKYADSLPAPKVKGVQQGLFAGVQSIDESFLEELDSIRKRLAKAFKKNNIDWDSELLTEATQRTIDRLVFMRFLEDKLIEPDHILAHLGAKNSIWFDFITTSKKLNAKYNGIVFREHHIDSHESHGPEEREFLSICEELSRENSPYDFNSIPIHILGSIYERFLGQVIISTEKTARVESKPEVRKAGGVNYTPQYIVRNIVDNTVGKLIANKTPKEISRMRFADISCGSGSFLITIFETLIYYEHLWYQAHPVDAEKDGCHFADGKWVLTLKQKQKLLTDCIYGVDIDSQAVEVTQLSLYLKLLEDETTATANEMQVLFKEKILPDLSRNIVNGNSLIENDILDGDLFGSESEKNIYPLNFALAFPHIFTPSPSGEGWVEDSQWRGGVGVGFDAIVGNPPYVRQEGLGAFKKYFKRKYTVYHSIADLYTYFIERGVSLLKPNGMFGYIVANKWMRANYGEPLRRWMKQQCIEEIIDFGDLPVFKNVTTYPCILRIRKKSPSEKFDAVQMKTLDFPNLQTHVAENKFVIQQKSLEDSGWSLSDETITRLIQKIKSGGAPLIEYVNQKIYYGVKTGLNEAFVIDDATRNKLIEENSSSANLIKPLLTGRDIKRYESLRNDKWLIFIPNGWTSEQSKGIRNKWNWFQESYPAIANHLEQFKTAAQKRYDQGEYWWELRSCDYYDEFLKPKIVWGNLSIVSPFTYDTQSLYLCAPACFFNTNDRYVLGCINSRLLWWYLVGIAAGRAGGFIEAKPMYVEKLPIKKIETSDRTQIVLRDKIISLVDNMLETKKQLSESKTDRDKNFFSSKCESLDKQIDECVYELYGLNEEERKMVEGV